MPVPVTVEGPTCQTTAYKGLRVFPVTYKAKAENLSGTHLLTHYLVSNEFGTSIFDVRPGQHQQVKRWHVQPALNVDCLTPIWRGVTRKREPWPLATRLLKCVDGDSYDIQNMVAGLQCQMCRIIQPKREPQIEMELWTYLDLLEHPAFVLLLFLHLGLVLLEVSPSCGFCVIAEIGQLELRQSIFAQLFNHLYLGCLSPIYMHSTTGGQHHIGVSRALQSRAQIQLELVY